MVGNNYLNLFERNPMPTFAFEEATSCITMVNTAAIEHYGYSREEFLAMRITELRAPQSTEQFEDFVAKHKSSPSFGSRGLPLKQRKKDGTIIDIEISAEVINVDDTDLVLAVVNDVTEKNRALRLLQENQQRLNLAISCGRMVMMDYNYQTRQVTVSGHGQDIIGINTETFLDLDNFLSCVHPDDHIKVYESMRLGAIGKCADLQFRVVRPDNRKIVWLEWRSNLVFDETGQPLESRGILVDVTSFKEAQDHLLESLRRISAAAEEQAAILNSIPANIALVNADGVIAFVNDGWKRFAAANCLIETYGVGTSYFSSAALDPETHSAYAGIQAVLTGTSDNFKLECSCHSPDEKRWFQLVAAPLVTNGTRGAVIMHSDITARRLAEHDLVKSRANLMALINNTTDLIWSCDKDLRLISANAVFRQGLLTRHGIVLAEGDTVMVMQKGTMEYQAWLNRYRQALNGTVTEFDIEVYDSSGEPFFYEVTLNPIVDNDEVIGVAGFCRNITEKKKNERRLQLTNERFEILSIATNDAVWDWDVARGTVQWNHGLRSIFGFEQEDRHTTMDWWHEQVHPDDFQQVNESLFQAFSVHAANWSRQYRFRCVNGSYKYVYDRGYVIYDDGKPVRMIGAIQDVHELTEYRMSLEQKVRERTRELHLALEKERELSEMKGRFVSIASHEFRTPLSAIQFASDFLQLYRNKITEDEIERKLESIGIQVDHMMSLLDDVLTVGKGGSGRIAVNKRKLPVRSFFDGLIHNVTHANNATHTVEASYSLKNEYWHTDEKLLFNIFNNLFSNAIKFSPGKSHIHFTCSEEFGQMLFDVADEGIGIQTAEMHSIFEPFTRGSNVGAISGTGLGLTIVKTAVHLLEGEIDVTSTAQYNTVFKIRIPR